MVTRTRFDYDFGTRKYSLNLTATVSTFSNMTAYLQSLHVCADV